MLLNILDDFINLTQGQLLVKYWWLWLAILVIAGIYLLYEKWRF